jgi:hypothetical protein
MSGYGGAVPGTPDSGGAFDAAIDEMMAEAQQARASAPLPAPPAVDHSAYVRRPDVNGYDSEPIATAANSFAADLAEASGTEDRWRTANGTAIGGVGETLNARDQADAIAQEDNDAAALSVDWDSETIAVQLPSGEVEYHSLDDAPPHIAARVAELAEHEGEAMLERGQQIIAAAQAEGMEVGDWLVAVAAEHGEDVALELAEAIEAAGAIAQGGTESLQHDQATDASNQVLLQAFNQLYGMAPAAANAFKQDIDRNPPQSLADVQAAYARAGSEYADPVGATVDTVAEEAFEDAQYRDELEAFGLPDEPWVAELVASVDGDVGAVSDFLRDQQ